MGDLERAPWPDWEISGLLGRGGFGTVYQIQRNLVNGDVEFAALKVISIPQNRSDIDEMHSEGYDDEHIQKALETQLKSIVSEYSIMRKMDGSANIVNCKDILYTQHESGMGWDIYIRMELLTPLLTSLPIDVSEETIIKIGKDICNALVLCQKNEIAHRDIKPQNMFISQNGDYKLGDFGIAKIVESISKGTRIGTFKYMAPEVYNNRPYGISADIYSLGLVLYWLLNERRVPFLNPNGLSSETEESAGFRRLSGEKIPEPAHGSVELKRIVMKACAYNLEDRYATAIEMLEDLNNLSAGYIPYGAKNQNVYTPSFKSCEATLAVTSNRVDSYGGSCVSPHNIVPSGYAAEIQPSVYAGLKSAPISYNCRVENFDQSEMFRQANQYMQEVVSPLTVISKKKNIKLRIFLIILILLVVASVVAYNFKCEIIGHEWKAATCTSPKICSICGKKEGTESPHFWQNATFKTPKVCNVCGKIEGTAIEYESISVSDEVLSIRDAYSSIVSAVDGGKCKNIELRKGVTAYYNTNNEMICVTVECGTEGIGTESNSYRRSYYFEKGELIFAFYSGEDSHRLYFYNELLMRWRYTSKNQKVTNHDFTFTEDYHYWEKLVLDEIKSFK